MSKESKTKRKGPKPGDRLAGYTIVRQLGRGNMGTVYLARQVNLDRLVALKTMRPKLVGEEEHLESFYREARAAGKINHPNIVRVYDVGHTGKTHYIAMEYVEGETVWTRMRREGALPVAEALAICVEVLKALAHAHRVGILHRDIKPDNIMVTKHGEVKVSDFGLATPIDIARKSGKRPRWVIGTLAYMPPELWQGKPVGPTSDLFSLGASLYHMVTGCKPFPGGSTEEILDKMKRWDLQPAHAVNPDVPKAVSLFIVKMMAPDAANRYASALEAVAEAGKALTQCVYEGSRTMVRPAAGGTVIQSEPNRPLEEEVEERGNLVEDLSSAGSEQKAGANPALSRNGSAVGSEPPPLPDTALAGGAVSEPPQLPAEDCPISGDASPGNNVLQDRLLSPAEPADYEAELQIGDVVLGEDQTGEADGPSPAVHTETPQERAQRLKETAICFVLLGIAVILFAMCIVVYLSKR